MLKYAIKTGRGYLINTRRFTTDLSDATLYTYYGAKRVLQRVGDMTDGNDPLENMVTWGNVELIPLEITAQDPIPVSTKVIAGRFEFLVGVTYG